MLDFNANGKAMAFGKVSEKTDGVEFGIKAYFNKNESPNGAIELPTNTDLNTVLDEGYYCISNTAISATITNKTITNNSTVAIKVLKGGNTDQKIQIYNRVKKLMLKFGKGIISLANMWLNDLNNPNGSLSSEDIQSILYVAIHLLSYQYKDIRNIRNQLLLMDN